MNLIARLLKALNSNAGPWQLAFGFTLGMVVGLTPMLSLHNVILLLCVLFFTVNISAFILSIAFFASLSVLLNPIFISIGDSVLNAPMLEALFTSLYNTNIGHLSQVFNTLTMGSLFCSLLLSPLLLFFSKVMVIQYREQFMAWIQQFRIVQLMQSSRLFQLYLSQEN